jgi:hypothetical protein
MVKITMEVHHESFNPYNENQLKQVLITKLFQWTTHWTHIKNGV